MLQHSFVNSFREHNWATSIVEFALLVLGIYLGFQLDHWNTDRLAQIEANEYSIQLLADLDRELTASKHDVAYYKQVKAFGEKALAAWDEVPQASTEALIIAFYQASNILALSSERGAYDLISSKGLVNLIGDAEFGSELSSYYAQVLNPLLTEQPPYRWELRGVIPNHIQGAIRNNCASIAEEGRLAETLASDCEIGLTESQAQDVFESIVEHPRMRFYLRQYVSKVAVNIYIMDSQIKEITTLYDTLESFQKTGGR